ncbi:putative phage repressor [Methylobacterium sp. 4-46]|uniref:S24 family peptidase n=1 Tax=unclassified Methylobacterium TaxID=2615210 RepID=UPI000165C85E|nr:MULTISPECIES: S24/S26 family peptidase [Methylobacterium]ACA18440.1 putative phage repressor [Methylobacterium sp. 4-46]WFT77732.1 S24/S26 family peptidase [Methylobacterium nodulans]
MDATDRASRLKSARERAGFDSPRAAAKHFRWNENTYKSREGGIRDYGVEEAKEYGRAFNISWIWLVSGEGGLQRTSRVRIEGMIGAGGEIDTNVAQYFNDELAVVEVDYPLPDDVAAYEVLGNSMLPKYDPGDVILVRKMAVPVEMVLGDVALVVTADWKRYLKRVLRGSTTDTYDLESFNAPTMKDVRIREVGMIHLIVPGKQVQRVPNGKEIERRTKQKPMRAAE